MLYKLTKDQYLTSKKYLWKDGRCLGHIFFEIKERQDIDWTKFRQDKTLKMSVNDRYHKKFNAVSYPNESCGQHDTIEKAIIAIENKQHQMYNNLENYDTIEIGADNV